MFGALWYLLSIQREDTCWRKECGKINCNFASLYCGSNTARDNIFLQNVCLTNGSDDIDPTFGIYLPALRTVSQSTSFFEKFFYCFWWGLQSLRFSPSPNYLSHFSCYQLRACTPSRNVEFDIVFMYWFTYRSSLGQNLKTSTYTWENLFAVFVSISGLVLFALLIGNVQVRIYYGCQLLLLCLLLD